MRKTNEQSLKDILTKLVNKGGFEQPLWEVEIRQIWLRDMGEYIARNTSYIRLKGHVLEIGIVSAGLRDELHYSSQKITSFLNTKLGKEVIHRVIIRA
jgi:hypothetical protein